MLETTSSSCGRQRESASASWPGRPGSQPLLCQIERGTKNPSLPVGLALAAALEVRVERLIGRG